MITKIILVLYLIDIVLTNQVYEEVDERVDNNENKRTPRQNHNDFNRPAAFSPPIFNYASASQQDLLQWRYLQQQIVDQKNLAKRQKLVRRERVAKEPSEDQIGEDTELVYKWKVDDDKTKKTEPTQIQTATWHVSNPNLEGNRRKITIAVPLEKVHLTTPSASLERTKKSVYNYKVNENDLDADSTNQHQQYADQISLPNNFIQNPQNKHPLRANMAGFAVVQKNEKDVEALSALIGKAPQDQLEGLKQLLQNPVHTKIIIPVISGAQPFHNKYIETTPGTNLAQIQAHLDSIAKVEAEKVLKKAQEQAIAHVKAQHEAIARAQIEAQKSFNRYQPTDQRRQKVVQVQIDPAVELKQHQYQARIQNQRQQQQQQQQHQQQLQAQSQTLVQTIHVPTRPLPPSPSPEALGEVFFRQQKYLEDSKKAYGDDDLQYASQYAFGYRIRDAHNGNDFGHEEKREGVTAKGHYHVLLPDGRTQNVEYWADDSGYHAKVTYSSFATHPQH